MDLSKFAKLDHFEYLVKYLEKLYEFDSKTVGGTLPNDDFYYLEK